MDAYVDGQTDVCGRIEARERLASTVAHLGEANLSLLVRRYVLGEGTVDLAKQADASAPALRMRLMRLRFAARAPKATGTL